MLKKVASVAFAVIIAIAACGCSGLSGGTLKVGVRSDIINFGYYNETAEKYYGLEIDIANEMAERMGYKDVEFVTVTPDDRKEMLLNGKVDCIVATYTISDSRTENFDFSPAYYTDNMQIVVEDSSMIDDINDLKNLNIGTMSGSSAAPLLTIKLYDMGLITDKIVSESDTFIQLEGASITKSPSYDELNAMLESGEIDAACMDKCIAESYMNDDRHYLDTVIAEQEYGVATQKDSELSEEVSKVIQEMLDDGTIDKLIDKWN
ncbi:MAG TPA: transporter substrate-binding domain-containing protein [Candidatus Eubacterium pullicola]|nr:transporter substrate-binding domain-containing protein [Candidatus Eubacterium pullicola]